MLEAALALAIHETNPALSPAQVKQYAKTVAKESRARRLDPWVFFAIVKTESRWTAGAIGHEEDGSCWVGLGQVRVPGCDPEKVQPLYDPLYNLHRSAVIQAEAKKWCKSHRCPNGWLFLYNNSTKYVSLVRKTAREAKHAYAKPALGRLRD